MEGIAGILVAALVGSVVYLIMWETSRSRARAWEDAARQVGVTNVQLSTTAGITTKLVGERGPLEVRIEHYQRGKHERGTRIVIGGLRHAGRLVVKAEGMGSQIAKAFGDREVEVGDETFDQVAYVQGHPALVRALFCPAARYAVQDLLGGRVADTGPYGERALAVRTSIADNELQVEIRERPFDKLLPRLPEVLRALVGVGTLLVRPDDLAARIAANTEQEPVARVRLMNLQTLAAEYPAHPATKAALSAALGDASLTVRLHAAIALGPEGQPTLLRLAEGTEVPDGVAGRAIASLENDFPTALAVKTLGRARTDGRQAVARACIDRLARGGAEEGIGELAALLSAGAEAGELAVAAAGALGTVSHPSAEQALMHALDHPSPEVRVAAAESLGRTGTPLAVVPLRECVGEHRFDAALRRAARQAITEIQSRVTGASPGQLSLTVDEVGQVTLSEPDARGHVSIAGSEAPAVRAEVVQSDGRQTAPGRTEPTQADARQAAADRVEAAEAEARDAANRAEATEARRNASDRVEATEAVARRAAANRVANTQAAGSTTKPS